jgi:hypothetical protein
MVSQISKSKVGPGLMTPARLFFAACLLASATAAHAQQPSPPAAPAQVGVPDPVVINKLVWSAMAALDQANQTGNYSVLRDLGAPSFQANNSAATLGGIFQAVRNQQIDLGYALVVSPTLEFPPAIIQGGLLRVRGVFPLRPTAIRFDLLFQNISGQWRIFGIAVAPAVPQAAQSTSTRR